MTKKILLVIPNFGFGGAQRVFSDHAKMFSKFNLVEECVFDLSLPNEYETGNVVHSLEVREGKNLMDKGLRFLERVRKLKKLKKKYHYDICISHLEGADYVNVLSQQSEKTIFVVHGSKIADENITGITGWIRKNILLPYLYKKANLIITVSDGIKDELIKNYSVPSANILSIPNYFNIQSILSSSEELVDSRLMRLKASNQIVLYSGRFAAQKNLLPLFTIFKMTKERAANVKLVLLGDGTLKELLMAECKRVGLSFYQEGDRFEETFDVYFLGYFQNPFPCIKESDVFVMSSKWEGFPMALCEAMAIGSCVMVSDCLTGPKQILHYLQNGNEENAGLLMPIPLMEDEDSMQQWSNQLVQILSDKQLRAHYALKGKERVSAFSEEKIAQKWKTALETWNE